MKTKNALLIAALLSTAALSSPSALGEEKKNNPSEHSESEHAGTAKKAGPNGGRILSEVEPHAEFLVTKERKIQITFLDDDAKAITPASQIITVTTGSRSAPTQLTFEKTESGFLSTTALPEGMNLPAIVQVKSSPEAKTVIVRFSINLADCPECDSLEYACTCEHEH